MTPYKILKKQKLPPSPAGRKDDPVPQTLKAMVPGDCFDYPNANPSQVYNTAKKLGIKVTMRKAGPKSFRVWRVS